MSGPRPAVFLDRDGTIIHDASYIRDPDVVRLLPGAARAIRLLNEHDIPVVVITNQSGIARGMLTERDYEAVQARTTALLRAEGASILADYHCPHLPEISGPCECRKPGTLLYRQAAAEHGLDLARSAYVGDRWRDVAPGQALGGRGILVPTDSTPPEELERAEREGVTAPTLEAAVRGLLAWRAEESAGAPGRAR